MSVEKTLTRAGIAASIRKAVPLSNKQSYRLVSDILEHMSQALSNNENIMIVRFGSFRIREKSERLGRNPTTRVDYVIPAHRVITFRPSDEVRQLVEKGLKL